MDIIDMLREAAAAREIATIVYNGGSRPGEPRVVIPVAISADDLEAIDPASHVRKKFKLTKIASVARASGESASNAAVQPAPQHAATYDDFDDNVQC